jgi:D-beta-D-heptose 7-phosphate kinase/D-beta-D-heptose 1-phosphate adenosyltransferase
MLPPHSLATILVLGDSMLDVYVSGKVERISPEAPVPVLRHMRDAEVVGGAANVAANVVRLGAAARLIALVGDDADGARLAALLAAAGVVFDAVIDPTRPTISKTRVMSGSHQLLRVDREDHAPIASSVEKAVLERVAAALPNVKALVISDYAKGLLTDRVLRGVIEAARAAGVPVLVDPKRRDFSIYAGAALIKPNRAELSIAAGSPCETDEDVRLAAETVIADTGASVLVTRSEKGMSWFAADATPIHMPTQAKLVFDVSGAGDTVIAAVACCIVNAMPVEQTMRIANLAAGIVVSKPGTATVSLDELRAAAHEHELPSAFRKGALATRGEAMAIREHWRREGLTVGFTNGCFDLVHPGHIAILRGSARHCDRLIVALNTDASTARLKGPTRPIQRETARATVVGAIHCVDLVVLFDDDTPLDLIAALSPDVLIKGADYTEDQIVGADVVRAAGGRVERVTLVEGQSTTELIRRGAVTTAGAR